MLKDSFLSNYCVGGAKFTIENYKNSLFKVFKISFSCLLVKWIDNSLCIASFTGVILVARDNGLSLLGL